MGEGVEIATKPCLGADTLAALPSPKSEDRDTRVMYELRCVQPITAFALVTPSELTGFDVSREPRTARSHS